MSRGGQRGFSLVEVLCAIVVLGVGIAGLTVGLSSALGTSRSSEEQTRAVLLAAGRIETLRAEGYIVAGDDDGDYGDEFPGYRWLESIEETDTEGLYEVSETIERNDKKIYELKTLLFDPPLTTEEENDPSFKERKARRERAKQ